MKLINIGFGNLVAAERVVAITSPDSAPIKRLVQDARKRGASSTPPAAAAPAPSSSWIPTM